MIVADDVAALRDPERYRRRPTRIRGKREAATRAGDVFPKVEVLRLRSLVDVRHATEQRTVGMTGGLWTGNEGEREAWLES